MFHAIPLTSGELMAILDIPWLVEMSCIHFHMVSPCVCVQVFPFLKDISHTDLAIHPRLNDLILT